MTPEEVKEFQQGPPGGPLPIDFLGKPLLDDGDLGPRTAWAMDIATFPLWRQKTVRDALGYNGQVELQPNRCELADIANKAAHVPLGSSYCASAASYIASAYAPRPIRIEASVARLIAQPCMTPTHTPKPGDFAYWLEPDGHGHIGIVIAADGLWTASLDANLQNRVQVVRYLHGERKYVSADFVERIPPVPKRHEIPIYRHIQGDSR